MKSSIRTALILDVCVRILGRRAAADRNGLQEPVLRLLWEMG